jgi:phage tail-like protein
MGPIDVGAAASIGLSIATSMGLGIRIDPAMAHSFMVEIDGLFVAGFTEVSGLESHMSLEPILEGGQNQWQEQRVNGLTYSKPLVLKRGITTADMLWMWHNDVVSGKIVRRNGSVVLMTKDLTEMWRWNFKDAFPISWIGPSFRADQSAVAFESIELVHRGISKDMGLSASISLSAGISAAGGLF